MSSAIRHDRREKGKSGLDIGEVLLEKDGHIRVEAFAVRHGRIGVGARPRFLTISSPRRLDSRRTARLCPTYQATRGSWLAPYATRVARRESGLLMRLFQVKPLDNPVVSQFEFSGPSRIVIFGA